MSRRLLSNALGVKYGGYRIFRINSNATIPGHWGHTIVSTNASSSSVTLTLPTTAQLNNKLVTVSARLDPAGNFIKLVESDGSTEVWTGYALGDFCTITSNGSVYDVIDENTTVNGTQAFTTDLSIVSASTFYKKTTGYAVDTDIGNWFDSVTNHRIDVGFDCVMLLTVDSIGTDNDTQVQVRVNNTKIQDTTGATLLYQHAMAQAWPLTLDATDTVEVYFGGNVNVSSTAIMGDAAKDETKIYWEVLRRRR